MFMATQAPVVISPKGPTFDSDQVRLLQQELLDRVRDGEVNMVMDLGHLHYIQSLFLGMLVALLRSCREFGGDLRICNANESISAVLEASRLNQIMDVCSTTEEAIARFRRWEPGDSDSIR